MKNIRQVVHGDYVATPVKNAFNNKTSYWFSKKGYTLAIYMFTVEGQGETEADFESHLTDESFKAYIPIFEEMIKRPFNPEVFHEESEKLRQGSVQS